MPDPARDARILLAHAARIEASRVTLIAPEDLASDIADRYEQLIALRAVRVPVSHLLGERQFLRPPVQSQPRCTGPTPGNRNADRGRAGAAV